MGWTNPRQTSLTIYDSNGNVIISLNGIPGADGNFIQITDSSGNVVASISQDGSGSFNNVNVGGDLTIDGVDYNDAQALLPQGLIAYGLWTTASATTTAELGVFEISFIADPTRLYEVAMSTWIESAVANDNVVCRLRDGGASQPVLASPQLIKLGGVQVVGGRLDESRHFSDVFAFTAGLHRILFTVALDNGTGPAFVPAAAVTPTLVTVTDIGSLAAGNLTNIAVANNGSGGGGSPITNQTKTYTATWSRSYNASGSANSGSSATYCYQGDDELGDTNRKSLIGFNFAAIEADLVGATIISCTLTLDYLHWWFNAGGTAIIGTHNSSASSGPGTYPSGNVNANRIQQSGWPNPGKQTVNLGTTIGGEFKSGATRGIALGPGPSSSRTYYGYAGGFGASSPPVLTIKYTS